MLGHAVDTDDEGARVPTLDRCRPAVSGTARVVGCHAATSVSGSGLLCTNTIREGRNVVRGLIWVRRRDLETYLCQPGGQFGGVGHKLDRIRLAWLCGNDRDLLASIICRQIVEDLDIGSYQCAPGEN